MNHNCFNEPFAASARGALLPSAHGRGAHLRRPAPERRRHRPSGLRRVVPQAARELHGAKVERGAEIDVDSSFSSMDVDGFGLISDGLEVESRCFSLVSLLFYSFFAMV